MNKVKVDFRISEANLKEIDKYRNEKLGGLSRTAMIINALKIYMLVLNRELVNSQKGIETQIAQIDEIIKMLNTKLTLLNEEETKVQEEISSINTDQIYDYDKLVARILKLIESWGKVPIETIIHQLKYYPEPLIFTALQKLKANKKLKIENGVWDLYDRNRNENKNRTPKEN